MDSNETEVACRTDAMPFVEAQFLGDPDQVAAILLLPGVAAGETEPGPARAEAGRAADAGDVSPVILNYRR